MKTKQLAVIELLFSTVVSFVFLQTQVCNAQDKGCSYLDRARPSVYLSLVSQETKKNKKDSGQVFLRLTNNSTCSLKVETDDYTITPEYQKYRTEKERKALPNGNTAITYTYAPPDGTQVQVYYDIQPSKNKPDKPGNYWEGRDLIFIHTMLSGRSIIFPIKAEHFRKRYGISILFNYEWESNDELDMPRTITHRVRYIYKLSDGYYKPQ